jgi:predicted RNase H-like nuclease
VIAGVDGCPGGRWVVVTGTRPATAKHRIDLHDVSVVVDLGPLLQKVRDGHIDAVAIDMPIGLLADRSRTSDAAARKLLGPRRASVFPTPVRATLDATDSQDACARSRNAFGKALSKQAFYLLDKIRDLDALILPSDQDRVVEAHPELAFTRLHGDVVPSSKHTARGQELREHLLKTELDEDAVSRVLTSGAAPRLDLIDAMALVTTAARVANGSEVRLGTDVDPTGKRAEVTY